MKHGVVDRWTDWPHSSVHPFLAVEGEDRAEALLKEYPLYDFGKGWDE